MKKSQADDCTKRLAKLFPNAMMNKSQAIEIARELERFELADVDRAIREHHREQQFLNPPALYKACEPIVSPVANSSKPAMPDQTFAQIIRKQRPDMATAGDHEVLLRYWQADWFRYKSSATRIMDALEESTASKLAELDRKIADTEIPVEIRDGFGLQRKRLELTTNRSREMNKQQFDGYRLKCRRGCWSSLFSHGMAIDTAESWAETIFSEPGHFRACLAELRGELAVPACA